MRNAVLEFIQTKEHFSCVLVKFCLEENGLEYNEANFYEFRELHNEMVYTEYITNTMYREITTE